jgi:serine protease
MKSRRVLISSVLVSVLAVGTVAVMPGAAQAKDVPPEPAAVDPSFGSMAEVEMDDAVVAVDLRDDVSAGDIADLEAKFGVRLEDNSPGITDDGKVETARVDPARREGLLAALRADPRVEAAEPLVRYQATFVPNDPKYADQWHLKRAGAETAWEYSCGRGVTVAVIDTGVACYDKGPFMKGTDLAGTRCVDGYNFVDKNADAYDDHGHGTHVAGTIAQTTNNGLGVAGLAYCANLMPVKVLSGRGSGTNTDVAEGIRFAADHGAQVINLSLGGPFPSAVIANAVKHALGKGVVVVAAAGNSGRSVGYPAAYKGVIAVSATDKNDNIAWFSSRGPQVVIGAPGVGVTQQTVCEGGKNKCEVLGVFNGTSMASPHVAGAAAMLMGAGVTDAHAVRELLTSTATEKPEKELFGAGIMNADKALTKVYWTHLLLRGLGLAAALIAVTQLIARARARFTRHKGEVAFGAALAGTGLLPFAPFLHLETLSGGLRPVVELLARPLGEWDMLLSVSLHKWLALATIAPAALGLVLFFGNKRLRALSGGLAIGTAAFALQSALSADVDFALGSFMLRLVMAGTAAASLLMARMQLQDER